MMTFLYPYFLPSQAGHDSADLLALVALEEMEAACERWLILGL